VTKSGVALAAFALWTAAPDPMPLAISALVTGPQSRVTLTNTATQPVTAWSLVTIVQQEGGRTHRAVETVDGYLSEITHGLPGSSERLERFLPKQSRAIALEPLPEGATAEIVAVVLDDGTAMGEEALIASIFARRVVERDAFAAVVDAFNEVLPAQRGEAALDALRDRLTAIARRADSPPCRAALDAVTTYQARGGSPEAIDQSLRAYAAFVSREHDLAAKHAERRGVTSRSSAP
jgi:hypothetical protein